MLEIITDRKARAYGLHASKIGIYYLFLLGLFNHHGRWRIDIVGCLLAKYVGQILFAVLGQVLAACELLVVHSGPALFRPLFQRHSAGVLLKFLLGWLLWFLGFEAESHGSGFLFGFRFLAIGLIFFAIQ